MTLPPLMKNALHFNFDTRDAANIGSKINSAPTASSSKGVTAIKTGVAANDDEVVSKVELRFHLIAPSRELSNKCRWLQLRMHQLPKENAA